MNGIASMMIQTMDTEALTISKDNNQKLSRLIQLIEGTGPHDPGLIGKVEKHELLLIGEGDKPGILTKVNIMWRIHIYLLSAATGLCGLVIGLLMKK